MIAEEERLTSGESGCPLDHRHASSADTRVESPHHVFHLRNVLRLGVKIDHGTAQGVGSITLLLDISPAFELVEQFFGFFCHPALGVNTNHRHVAKVVRDDGVLRAGEEQGGRAWPWL